MARPFLISSRILLIVGAVALCLAAQTPAPAVTTERVSVASDGTQANGGSEWAWISGDGRYVAFNSGASTLVPGDTNSRSDVFVHDRLTHATQRVSVASDGTQSNGYSRLACISADGRCVAFESDATNLVPGDTNGQRDVFVHDRMTGTTERVNVSSAGVQGNGYSGEVRLSGDGRFAVFTSYATNLVSGDANGKYDVFLRDRLTGTTELVSVSTSGAQADDISGRPFISPDGRFVAFYSNATNLAPGDTNGRRDVFVRDRVLALTERVSIASDGSEGDADSHDPSISGDGRFVAFYSNASNLVPGDTNVTRDVFVHDRGTGETECVSVSSAGVLGNRLSQSCAISDDGRFVVFFSTATNLVPDDTNGTFDIFLRDRQGLTTERVSLTTSGAQANDSSTYPHLSEDGRFVAYQSLASNLVDGDTNGLQDVFATTVSQPNAPPSAAFTWSPETPSTQDVVQLTDASSDPDGTIVSWAWDFGDSGTSADQNPTHQYAGLGTYTVSLTVTDDDGAGASASHDVTVPGNTPASAPAVVDLGSGVTITFAEVTAVGDTTLTVSGTPPHGPPAGFRLAGTYYEISTTAGYTPPITICLAYDPAGVPARREAQLTLFHSDGAGWSPLATSVDTANHVACAQVDGLSWFALGWPEYDWLGFLPPVAERDKPFKRGSTIPIRFRIAEQDGSPVPDAVCTLTIYYLESGAPAGEAEVVSTAAGDGGNQFRYDAEGDCYIFNLGTKDPSYLDYFTYLAEVALDDGSTQSVEFALK